MSEKGKEFLAILEESHNKGELFKGGLDNTKKSIKEAFTQPRLNVAVCKEYREKYNTVAPVELRYIDPYKLSDFENLDAFIKSYSVCDFKITYIFDYIADRIFDLHSKFSGVDYRDELMESIEDEILVKYVEPEADVLYAELANETDTLADIVSKEYK